MTRRFCQPTKEGGTVLFRMTFREREYTYFLG